MTHRDNAHPRGECCGPQERDSWTADPEWATTTMRAAGAHPVDPNADEAPQTIEALPMGRFDPRRMT
jgi:hypothetical protein